MGIGIDIRVNGTDKLREAKKEIGMLNNGLRESEQLSDITIQTSGLPNKNDTQGMTEGLRTYASEADKARQSIESLINYQRKLTNAVSPRTQQVAQEQPQRQYKIRDPHVIEPPQNIVSVSHPKGDAFYDNYDPKHEKTVKPRAEVTNAVSTRTQQVAQEYYNTTASQATVMDAAKKLKQIDAEGSKKGGVITPGQAAEASRLYKLIQDEQKKYEKEIERTGTKLDELFAKKKKLEQTSPLLRTEGEQKAVEQLKQQIEELTASSEKYQRTQDKSFDKTNKSATQSNHNIQGYRQQEDPAAAATMGSTIKKALGWGLAAAGGFSLLGFLGSSRAQYQQAVGHEGKLSARGIKGGYNDGVGIGITPLEQMQMLEGISQSTGMFGKKANSAANMAGTFGKYTGIDPSQVAGMYGTMYQATGNQQAGTGALSMMGEAIKKGMDKSRASELLQMVSRNTQATANAMGGAGGNKEAGAATALAIEAMKSQQAGANYGNYAKSGEFQHVMQNGLQGAGTGAGDIRLFKAIGGYDGPMNFEKIHDMNIMKQGGFANNPAIMTKILGSLRETSDKGKAGELESMMESWGIKGLASEKIIDMGTKKGKDGKRDDLNGTSFFETLDKAIKKSGSFEKLSKGTAEDKKLYAEMQNAVGKNPALQKEKLEAERQMVKIEAGEQLNRIFGEFESAALKMGNALMKTDFEAFERAAKALGPIGVGLGVAAAALTAAPFLAALKTLSGVGGASTATGAAGLGFGGAATLAVGTGIAAYAGTTALLDTEEGRAAQAARNAEIDKDATPGSKASVRATIRRAAGARGLAQDDASLLLAMAEQESGFDTNAMGKEVFDKKGKSRGRAAGAFQYMPENSKGWNPKNADQAAVHAAKDYANNLKLFGGDREKAIAAHNAGVGGVQKAVQKGGADWKKQLPAETQNYLNSIMAQSKKFAIRGGISKLLMGSNDEREMERNPTGTAYRGGFDRQQDDLDRKKTATDKQLNYEKQQQVQNAKEIGDAMAGSLSLKLDELIRALKERPVSIPAQAPRVSGKNQ